MVIKLGEYTTQREVSSTKNFTSKTVQGPQKGRQLTSCMRSWAAMALSTFFLLVSCTSPPSMNSSNMKKAFSKLKMMSSSHTCGTGIANALKSTLKHCQHISKTLSKILSAQFKNSIQNYFKTTYCQHSPRNIKCSISTLNHNQHSSNQSKTASKMLLKVKTTFSQLTYCQDSIWAMQSLYH